MRQRVALARAYATDPEVMLLDEPFAALDAQTREFMQELLHETSQVERRTAMLITHSVEEAIFLSQPDRRAHQPADVRPRGHRCRRAVAAHARLPHRAGVPGAAPPPRGRHATHDHSTLHSNRKRNDHEESRRRPRRGPRRRARPGAGACGALDEGGGDDKKAARPGGTKVKVGYLHTIAVDDKLQLGQLEGHWADAGSTSSRSSSTPASRRARRWPAATSTSPSWAASPRTSRPAARARSLC